MSTQQSTKKLLEIRKYPNRRYYDSTHSQHITLEEIYNLICDGYEISVKDSKTDEDITAKVLTQILLDQAPQKLDIFPNELLHQVIRSNEKIVHDFVEKYFNEAFSLFVKSQKHMENYLRNALGLESDPTETAQDWNNMMMKSFEQITQFPFGQGNPFAPPKQPKKE